LPVSLSGGGKPPLESGVDWRFQMDKSKFALFKPLSLDVIFHGCKIAATFPGNFDAFAR
jgi:hypothetical protein